MITVSWMLALALAPSGATAAAPPSAWVAQDPAAEYAALLEEYETAREEFYARLRKHYDTYEEGADEAAQAEFRKQAEAIEATDPGPAFRDKFMELARRVKGTEPAAKCWIQVLQLSQGGLQSLPQSPVSQAIAALLADHIESKELVQIGFSVDARALGKESFTSLMTSLREKSPHREVQASALRALADSLVGWDATPEDLKAARPLWVELGEKYGELKTPYPPPYDKTYGQIAEGQLFSIDNLQVGCMAPDFEAVDETGAKFKLSDYKGKVVVIDFWGYW